MSKPTFGAVGVYCLSEGFWWAGIAVAECSRGKMAYGVDVY